MQAITHETPVLGLTDNAVEQSRAEHGRNLLTVDAGSGLLGTVKEVVLEPMFLLLVTACTIYFAVGQIEEAITLIVALMLVAGISVYQSIRSDKALGALRDLTQPQVQVRRNSQLMPIPVEDIVVGDAVLIEEGGQIPADGTLDNTNDFSVDESILTGESVSVSKTTDNPVFAGSTVASGSAWLTVTAVGKETELGRIGHSIDAIQTEKTPLQIQISQFVMRMAWIGAGAFLLVWGINFVHSGNWMTALLFGLTLAMSILPEEIPVAFSSFMALGAVRLSQMGVLTKQPQTVESLGSATVICTDKTGTITQNGMTVRQIYDGATDQLVPLNQAHPSSMSKTPASVLCFARWASETVPFDPMEQAIVDACSATKLLDPSATFPMVHEYPLSGTPPMMTHVRQAASGELLVAGKGAVEHILSVCRPTSIVAERIRHVTKSLSEQGFRVLGVAQGTYLTPDFPVEQDEFTWAFLGLVALENPPKPNAANVIKGFTRAGIQVKMITGDYPETALAIARQVGLPDANTFVTGKQIMEMDDATLQQKVTTEAV
ncbi:MAG: HAD family hydrolase, partial [Cytophagaceae bacterium]